jgi:hypothetical protein
MMNEASLCGIGKSLRFKRRAARFAVLLDGRIEQPFSVGAHQFMALFPCEHEHIAARPDIHYRTDALKRSGFQARRSSIRIARAHDGRHQMTLAEKLTGVAANLDIAHVGRCPTSFFVDRPFEFSAGSQLR